MRKIDFHAHTSVHKLWGLHTQTATISDLVKLAAKHDLKKIVLLATYFPFKGSGLKNQELLDRISGNPLFCMFASLDVQNNFEQGLQELRELAKQGKICGIKLYPGYQVFSPSDPKVFPVYQLAREFALPVMFHGGELHHCCQEEDRKQGRFRCGQACKIDQLGHLAQPESFVGAIKNFPTVNFIISHLANPYFEELRQIMSLYPNVYTDISGQFISATSEAYPEYQQLIISEIRKFLEMPQGIYRVMFGTDFPIQSHEDSVSLIESLNLSADDAEKIYFSNAAKLLKLTED
ncbi:MAG: amidohydrolase family protein [Candidatus Parcubacteria bacterium]|nr:amidohydrolase family protein [Candidatus Parcubacteria bacterium]